MLKGYITFVVRRLAKITELVLRQSGVSQLTQTVSQFLREDK